MLKTFAFFLWLLSVTATLFILATDVWHGAPVLHFVGTVVLGMIGPLGTWAIAKRYPNTDRAACRACLRRRMALGTSANFASRAASSSL